LTDLKRDADPKARAAVGRALAITGWDNRKGVGIVRDASGVALPDIDWVEIPSGEFKYGDESEYAAKPQRLTLPTFYTSRFPVTYAQFQTFLDDPEGYADPQWFKGLAADDDDRRMDEQWFKFANHPRETVNWYQAMAFCRWLSWRLGGGYDLKKVAEWAVRLPTEFEWEKAARGTDGRIYPYEGDYDAAKGNTGATGIGQTSAVGIFPNGASPYGVMDMSGNVWEWCLSDYYNPSLDAAKEDLGTKKTRVLRGGSWLFVRIDARAVFRYIINPLVRLGVIGFRVVVGGRPPSLVL
jgi:formylglycine-generating enzyme required for sulfatase activity